MIYLELLVGLLLLVAGGDSLVRGAVAIAKRIRVSPLLIGLTLVGFGTSTPELITSLKAAFAGSPGIAIGNVVGSNIANILLILGIAALIHPLRTSRDAFLRDGAAVLLAAIACVAVVLYGALDRLVGGGLVLLLITYIVYTYQRERVVHDASAMMHEAEVAAAAPMSAHLWIAVLFTLGGLALTMLGADFLVDSSIALARDAGISETVVGLTIVAVGTSLPELVISIMAAIRRQPDVVFGNIVGSNIYNVLGILGVTAVIEPIPVPPEIAKFDIWVMLGTTVLLLAFAVSGWRLSRVEGGILLGSYLGYLAYLTSIGAP